LVYYFFLYLLTLFAWIILMLLATQHLLF
jgi:hypothetical protein